MFLCDAIYSTSLTVSLIPQVEMNSFSLCSVLFSHPPRSLLTPASLLLFYRVLFILFAARFRKNIFPADASLRSSRGRKAEWLGGVEMMASTAICFTINFSIYLSWKLLILSSCKLHCICKKFCNFIINDFLDILHLPRVVHKNNFFFSPILSHELIFPRRILKD